MSTLARDYIEDDLAKSHENQQREAIPAPRQTPPPAGAYSIYVLFNLEAADGEGHAILALGPEGGPLTTYSFYRQGKALEAPALMACLEHPETFAQIQEDSGWIIHGQPGNEWNEHVNAALALWCDKEAYGPVADFAELKRTTPGTYNLVTYNCVNFVEEALAKGSIHLTMRNGKPLHTFIPKDAFRGAAGVRGAHLLGQWKYWFDLGEAPRNGLRTISDIPGQDQPLH